MKGAQSIVSKRFVLWVNHQIQRWHLQKWKIINYRCRMSTLFHEFPRNMCNCGPRWWGPRHGTLTFSAIPCGCALVPGIPTNNNNNNISVLGRVLPQRSRVIIRANGHFRIMKVMWRSADQWRSFQGQWSFQCKGVTSYQERSFQGQWSLQLSRQRSRSFQGQRVASEHWRFVQCQWSFQCQRVTLNQRRSRSMVISRPKGHFMVKGSHQINEDQGSHKGRRVNSYKRRSCQGQWTC